MKRIITFIFVLISTILLAQKDSAEYYKYRGAECAIFPCTIPMNEYYKDSIKSFTPSHAEVNMAENSMRANIKSLDTLCKYTTFANIAKNLGKYRRQYFGFIAKNGHKILYINCFRLDKDDSDFCSEWMRKLVLVSDGGDYYWQTTFDLTTGKFIYLGINGMG